MRKKRFQLDSRIPPAMKTTTSVTIATTTITLAFLLFLTAAASAAGQHPPSPPPLSTGCAAELVSISPCLSYISAHPNNVSAYPSRDCCDAFSYCALATDGDAACLCHLVRDPFLLGFPVDAGKVYSVLAACGPAFAARTVAIDFQSLCEDPRSLPPLRSPSAAEAAGDDASSPAEDGDAGAGDLGNGTATGDQLRSEGGDRGGKRGNDANGMAIGRGKGTGLLLHGIMAFLFFVLATQ